MTTIDISFVDETVARAGRHRGGVITLLQAIQGHYRYLPEEALRRLCEITEITPSDVAGVSTFYTQFRRRPMGRHLVRVCHGTACHVKGSVNVTAALRTHLGLAEEEDTDKNGLFTLEKVACLGCCTLAPVVQIDDVTYGHLTPDRVPVILRDFLELQQAAGQRPDETETGAAGEAEIRIGLGSCCVARGSRDVYDAAREAVAARGISARVKIVGCVGMCHQTPLLEVLIPGGKRFLYAQVRPEDTGAIVARHFRPRGLVSRTRMKLSGLVDRLLTDETWPAVTRYAVDARDPPVASFLDLQKHIATEFCGEISPTDADDYLARGGFRVLEECLRSREPRDIIDTILRSGLRGRGGAGYSTGMKWLHVNRAESGTKYVICNGDEGDPGAFMDRMLLESYPYRVIEGMAIAARAVGASEGYLYIRAEYPLAVTRVRHALKELAARKVLGDDVLGTGFRLRLDVMEGAGAFVCGEETALIESLEGRRGMPHFRPPYPSTQGFRGKPTLVNNVETLALVPWILKHGADAFAALGTPTSKGTKVFALAGKVKRGGLIEVPMGITIRQIVEQIGGGVGSDARLKAVQIGGPSGGCLPASLADTSIDYESLHKVGAIMGSGGLVVLDDTDCMVEIARFFLEFTQNQSCGKCTFCRIGTRRMLDILTRLCEGKGHRDDVNELERLAAQVARGSLCGLGKTAPNPVLSTLRYFRDEYDAHLRGKCPAGKCRALITYEITDKCIGCTRCAQRCPVGVIAMKPYEKHAIDVSRCIRCGTCMRVCPSGAVKVN